MVGKISLNFYFILVNLACAFAFAANTSNCSEATDAIGGDDSPNLAKFQDLFNRGLSAQLSDFLILWYPQNNQAYDGAYFFDCESVPWGGLKTDDSGNVPSNCKPDVLYSWGSHSKLHYIESEYGNNKPWTGIADPSPYKTNSGNTQGTLFTSISPIATYSYGPVSIRLKIKDSVNFGPTFPANATSVSTFDANATGELIEFDFLDFQIVESWSYGTPEQYDEIVKDILRISSGKQAIGYSFGEPKSSGMQRVYDVGVSEFGTQDEATLKQNLLNLIGLILNHSGHIYFTAGACQNRSEHFQSSKPTYFNTTANSISNH